MVDLTARTLAPLARRIRNLVNRATLGLVDDDATMQSLQVDATKGETLDAVEHWQGYGISVHPKPGGEVLLLSAGGSRAKPIAVAVADRRYRVTGLESGEVVLHDDQGQTVHLGRDVVTVTDKRGQKILLHGTGCQIQAATFAIGGIGGTGACPANLTGDWQIIGNLHVIGNITATGDIIAGTVSLKNHVHSGVTPGGGNTGVPVP